MVGGRALLAGALVAALVACTTSESTNPTDPPASAADTGASASGTIDDTTGGTVTDDATTVVDGTTAGTSADTTGASVAPSVAPTTSTSTSTTTTTTTIAPTTTTTPGQVPVVEAAAYTVYDMRSGEYLAQSEGDTQRPVGSLIKILAAQVAYEAGDPTRIVVAPDSGLVLSDDESTIGIRPRQELSRDLLIRAMLKASANDAARMLAIDIAGSEAAFAERMNATAARLAMPNTRAVNATGLDADGQFSSANDITNLGVAMMANPSFQLAVSDPVAELNGQAFPNTNDLIGVYPGADGIKTGHTTGAGWCVLASATRENRRIVVAVLGAPSEEARDAAATALLNWGFAQP